MPEETELRFEAAVSQLERIVESLERGEPELAEALVKYESGVRLLSRCYALLERAERSVALLTGVDGEGKPLTAPFNAAATWDGEKDATTRSGTKPVTPGAESSVGLTPKPGRARRSRPTRESEPDLLEPPF